MGLIIKGPPSEGYHHFPYDPKTTHLHQPIRMIYCGGSGFKYVSDDLFHSAKMFQQKPSLKLTAKAPENEWLEDEGFPFGKSPNFRGKLLVSGSVTHLHQV